MTPASPQLRVVARRLLVISVVAVAVIVFQPQPVVASGTVGGVHDLLQRLGAPDALTGARTEALLNVAMFVPAGLLAMLAFERISWRDVSACAFVGSMSIELMQGFMLSARSAQAIDVVTNTTGGLIGALLGLGVRRWLASQPGRSA